MWGEKSGGGIAQRWLLVESQARQESDWKKLEKKIEQEKKTAQEKIRQLSRGEFENRAVALAIAKGLSDSLKYHRLTEIQGNYFPPDSKKLKAKLTDNYPSQFYFCLSP
jgi:transposase